MKKHDSIADISNKEQKGPKYFKYGISQCERFQINKEGIEAFQEKKSLSQNKKSATSSANSGNNGNYILYNLTIILII